MHFAPSPEQTQLVEDVRRFAREQLPDDATARDQASEFSREQWQACADFGLLGLALPKEYSGSIAHDPLTCVLALEAFGQACTDSGLCLGLSAQIWTSQNSILMHGTEDQKQRFLPKLSSGEWIACDALTEPEHGSDLSGISTTATPCEGGHRLNGTKTLITMAPLADVAVIIATVDQKLGAWGLTAFLVERTFDGFEASPPMTKMGLRTLPLGEIRLKDCFVPDDNRLGPVGAGNALMAESIELERCCILASQLGMMQRQLEAAIEHAKTRQQFGQPIGKFQSVSNRIVDMATRIETARCLLYKVAWLKSQGKSATMEAAMLKLYLSEQSVLSGLEAIRVHGGRGYLSEAGIERDLRDAIGSLIYAGTSDIQRNVVAGMLGLPT